MTDSSGTEHAGPVPNYPGDPAPAASAGDQFGGPSAYPYSAGTFDAPPSYPGPTDALLPASNPPPYAAAEYPAAGYPAPGYPAPAPGYPGSGGYPGFGFAPAVAPRNGMGTAALVLGIIGVVMCWNVFGIVLNILAVIFGGVGLGRAKSGVATNRGAALAGLILGIVGLALLLLFAVAGIAYLTTTTTTR